MDPVTLPAKNLSDLVERVRVPLKNDRRTEDWPRPFGSAQDKMFGPFHVDLCEIQSPHPSAFAVIVECSSVDGDDFALAGVDKTSGAQIARVLPRQVELEFA